MNREGSDGRCQRPQHGQHEPDGPLEYSCRREPHTFSKMPPIPDAPIRRSSDARTHPPHPDALRPRKPTMERTARVGPDLVVTLLRNWHGVVPEDLPLFSVERRETTHERMRIMLIGRGDVKFKLFIAGISKRRKWQVAASVRQPDGCAVSRHGHERNPFLTKLLSTMASAMSFMGLRICWLWRCRV